MTEIARRINAAGIRVLRADHGARPWDAYRKVTRTDCASYNVRTFYMGF